MKDLRGQGTKEGWSTLAVIGMVVLIAAAIAAAIWLAPAGAVAAAIGAIITAIESLIALAVAGTVRLLAGLATMFALSPNVRAEAAKKGDEKQKRFAGWGYRMV